MRVLLRRFHTRHPSTHPFTTRLTIPHHTHTVAVAAAPVIDAAAQQPLSLKAMLRKSAEQQQSSILPPKPKYTGKRRGRPPKSAKGKAEAADRDDSGASAAAVATPAASNSNPGAGAGAGAGADAGVDDGGM